MLREREILLKLRQMKKQLKVMSYF